jgi:hypothetical protein
MKLRVALAGSVFLHRWLSFPDEASAGQAQVMPLPMSLAGRDNEYFRLYRKLMSLK